jgi:sugar lactone lactonase YvrE
VVVRHANGGDAAEFSVTADANTLLGSSAGGGRGSVTEVNPGSLFAIDPATGVATLVGPTGIVGDRGESEVSDIAPDPTTGVLYGIVGSACGGADLITINRSTGAGTLVGPVVGAGFDVSTGTSGCAGGSDALAFSRDGTLYVAGWNGEGEFVRGKLLRVDKNTGAVSAVMLTTGGIHIAGLAFDGAGVLWASRGGNGAGNIHTIDPATGATVTTVVLRNAAGEADLAVVSDIAFGPDGTLYASLPRENALATIDRNTGVITRIGGFGTAVTRMSGLAFTP